MPERAFPYEGDDAGYIKHLESLLKKALYPPSYHGTFDPASTTSKPSQRGIEFIEWKPGPGARFVESHPVCKQLDAFIGGVPIEERWQEARVKARIDTPVRNQHALKLILGHASLAVFHDGYETTAQPPALSLESDYLVARGCEYGRFIARCSHDRNFAVKIAAFQNLVFCSYCVVMMRAGISQDVTNDTMRRYTGQGQRDHTLAKYRNGAVWASRCIATLLTNGWGHKSWEIFLLGCPSPAQLARFAAYKADSYKRVSCQLGQGNASNWERGWIPYCIPCIVHYLTGYTVPLSEICNALGYEKHLVLIQAISMPFQESLYSLFFDGGGLPVPFAQSEPEIDHTA